MRIFVRALTLGLLMAAGVVGAQEPVAPSPFDLSKMTLAVQVEEGLSGDDVDESIKSLATTHGIFYVFFAPLYKQIEAVTGEPFRHLSIHMLCDAATAGKMVDYQALLATMMPCRIAVVEDPDGKLWIYTTNPDIFTMDPNMPEDLQPIALGVANKIKAIVQGAAAGDF